jgi:hypothetical protein
MPPRTHITRREASEFTGFSEQTFAKWAVTGNGPKFTKIGTGRSARVRYAIADLEAFLRGETERLSAFKRGEAALKHPNQRASAAVALVEGVGAGRKGIDVTTNAQRASKTTPISDRTLTAQLAQVVMGWRIGPGRFLKSDRSWTPRWKFQPLKRLEHALELLDKTVPQHFGMEGDEKTGFRVKVRIAGVIGEAHGQSKPRTIAYAIARAVGIAVPAAVDRRKSNGI